MKLMKAKPKWNMLALLGIAIVIGLVVFRNDQQVKSIGSESISYSAEETAIGVGGCFGCMEPPFEKLIGVKSVVTDYTGGKEGSPAYHDVSLGSANHVEAVIISFHSKFVTYEELLDVY